MISVKTAVLGDLDQEVKTTRALLERVPDQNWDWKPHEKSMALGELATHIANIPYWMITTLDADSFDLAAVPEASRQLPKSRAELLAQFDERIEAVKKSVDAFDASDFDKPWSLLHGEHVVFTMPKAAVFRNMCTSHLIHHRAQLGVYLRMLDVPLPMSYGPTADERGGF